MRSAFVSSTRWAQPPAQSDSKEEITTADPKPMTLGELGAKSQHIKNTKQIVNASHHVSIFICIKMV